MIVNPSGWKPSSPVAARSDGATTTGNRALMLEESLIFEIGDNDTTGVDFDFPSPLAGEGQPSGARQGEGTSPLPNPSPAEGRGAKLAELARTDPIGLPGLTEPEAVRHYTRLSRQNYAIDLGLFPLGSCTMKHNPRLNEKLARLPGFADIHPLQPQETVQGALQVINELAAWLIDLTGMHVVAMSPKAGAHGELCGLLCIRAALQARGDARQVVLVPESAHGTNPATAAFCGYRVEDIPATAAGRVDLEALKARLGPDVAAVMITNPNTCGLFEPEMKAISDAVHAAGALVYCDGANFNAIVGKVRPGDLGIDAMHINLHKTFSTPHGGGGPGSGPVVLSEALAPFAPLPFAAHTGDGGFKLVEEESAHEEHPRTFGRMTAFHGQMGMFTRALTYILSHGADGLRQVAEDSVLNANYILRSLEDVLDAPFAHSGPCMHEAIFSDKGFAEGFSTIDLAKALIDEGFHPMTMYFPLVVHGAMLVEPTETESRAALDQFIAAMRSIAERARAGDESLKAAPIHAPRRRLDETLAARKPVLAYRTPAPTARTTDRAPGSAAVEAMSGRRFYEAAVGADSRRSAPAALRNREPIAEVLRAWLPPSGVVLELASGTGEHAAFFAEAFPALVWQPSDAHPQALKSIAAWRAAADLANFAAPITLDAAAPDWPIDRADAILCINMVHISPWAAALGLLDGAGRLLGPGAPLILYGPWLEAGVDPAPSNLDFDGDLRSRDPEWGLREVETFAAAAAERGLALVERRAMPANNLMLLLRRAVEARKD